MKLIPSEAEARLHAQVARRFNQIGVQAKDLQYPTFAQAFINHGYVLVSYKGKHGLFDPTFNLADAIAALKL